MKRTPLLIWILSFLLFWLGFLMGGQQLLMIQVSEYFGLGILGMGTMISVRHISSTFAPVLMGVLADRVGKKVILVIFAVLFGISCFFAATAPWLWTFLGALLILGAGSSVCESITSAVCVDVSRKNGTKYINLTQCLLSTGAILGPIVLSALPPMDIELWRLMYLGVGIPLILSAVFLSFLRFPKPASTDVRHTPLFQRDLLTPALLAFMAAMLIYIGLESGFGYFIEPLFDSNDHGLEYVAFGISAYWAGMAFSRLVYSFFSYPPRITVKLSFIAVAILFISLISVPSPVACVILCGIVGIAYGPIWTTIVAGTADRFPDNKASVTGLLSTSSGIGGILYPILTGGMVELLDIRVGFLILAASAIVGAVLSSVLQKAPPKN